MTENTAGWLHTFCTAFTQYHPTTGKHRKKPRAKEYTLRYLMESSQSSSCLSSSQESSCNTEKMVDELHSRWNENCFGWVLSSVSAFSVIYLSNYCFES